MARSQKKTSPIYMRCLTFRPSYTVAYSLRADGLPMGRKSDRPKINSPAGVLSERAMRRIRNALNWMIICSDYKRVYSKKENKTFGFLINFITLTLSEKQKHSDQEIKSKLLNPFLDWMKRSHNANCYLWKAEAQKETGNIHFHITTNVFIHWKSIRRKWNELQYKLGYEKAFTDGNKDGKNSTDVHAVKNIKKIGWYLAKYFVKNETDRRQINGKLWGCSTNLSKLKITLTPHDDGFSAITEEFFHRNEFKLLKDDFSEVYIHSPLNKMKLPIEISKELRSIKEKINGGNDVRKIYTIESFY